MNSYTNRFLNHNKHCRMLIGLLVIVVILFSSYFSYAAKPSVEEIKAVYIFKFIRFVKWPKDALNGTYRVCVLGNSTIIKQLKSINGYEVDGRIVDVKHFNNIDDVNFCHILFVSSEQSSKLPRVLKKLNYPPVLTVGETEEFLDKGGIVEFFTVDNYVRFKINQRAAENTGLIISSQLLHLTKSR